MDLFEFRPYKVENYRIFCDYFKFFCRYDIRMNFTLEQYFTRSIPRTFETMLKPTINLIRVLILLGYLFAMLFFPDNRFLFQYRNFERKFNVQSSWLVIILAIIVLLFLDSVWYISIRHVLAYNFPFINVMDRLRRIQNHLISKRYRRSLINYYLKAGYSSGMIYRILMLIVMLATLTLYSPMLITSRFDECLFNTLIYILGLWHSSVYLGVMFVAMFHFTFTIKLLRIRFYLHVLMMKQFTEIDPNDQLKWYRLLREYNAIYFNILQLNHNSRLYFFLTEMLSKACIVFATIFYSKQFIINIYSLVIIITAMILFCLNNLLFFDLAYFPTHNHLYYCILTKWASRQQFSNKNFNRNLFVLFKSNTLIQRIQENRIGFTCGSMFLVTRFRSFDSFILNFVFILLFYKKLLLNFQY
ncbi:hypothetical protein SSS_03361 [Sarcoptes scabiei]|uniref:Gustatory receptor n=1 Tax=Sarcoptes scabiei TaxID=52283 RepID=A0A834RG67_SARSC|nr:hypothetical protein SSS_03361 [Sarcoptes scabiei]